MRDRSLIEPSPYNPKQKYVNRQDGSRLYIHKKDACGGRERHSSSHERD
jgi:hypothetical protein